MTAAPCAGERPSQFAAPIVVRMPGGFSKCGDPWHSVSSEVTCAHAIGWQVLYPIERRRRRGAAASGFAEPESEHIFRTSSHARCRLGAADHSRATISCSVWRGQHVFKRRTADRVTWGAMVERCVAASRDRAEDIEILDLRTIVPWDRETVLDSVRKTHRCLIVHEDTMTAGFGAEIAAVVARDAFFKLDAPVER